MANSDLVRESALLAPSLIPAVLDEIRGSDDH